MTYYNIFFNNMKRSFKNYTIYLMSTVFSVIVYYLFIAIKYNPQVLGTIGGNAGISGLFNFTGGIVLIFAGVFIGYSNSFFVRKRKKEIALYALMGMKKKCIARMLFIENVIIAIMSLAIGIGVGTVFSKLVIMALLRMLNQVVFVEFSFSMKAALNTSIVYMIIFVIASLNSYKVIKRIRLIELFSASKKNDKPFKTRPIYAIISFGFVAFGYWLSQNMLNPMLVMNMFLVLVTVITGTYGLFAYFLGFFVRILKSRKKTYYKGNNILAISNINYRIKNHSITLATIAILSATTIVALGMADSLYYDFNTKAKNNYPFTYAYNHMGEELDAKALAMVNESQEVDLIGSMKITPLRIKARYTGTNTSKYSNFAGDLTSYQKYNLLSLSQYNEAMRLRNMKEITLEEGQGLLAHTALGVVDYDYTKGGTYDISLDGQHEKSITVVDVEEKAMIISHYNGKCLVVKDQVYDAYMELGAPSKSYTCIKTSNQLDSRQLTSDMSSLIPKDANLIAYYNEYRSANQTYALLAFTAFFISIVFLLSTGSIIYFKLITEANEEKERYGILKKIGISKKDITWSVRKQILMMFVVPLIVGLLHSAFALNAFGTLLGAHILMPVVLTMVGYSVIYLIYYILTVNYYKKIIWN